MTDREAHPLDLAARAAYEAFRLGITDQADLAPWETIPPQARECWRAIADAVLMVTELRGQRDQP